MTSADDYVIQILLDHGLVTEEDVETARTQVPEDTDPYQIDTAAIDYLVTQQYITFEQITELLAQEYGMDVMDMTQFQPDPAVIALLEPHIAKQHKALPLQSDGGNLDLIICDPLDQDSIDNISHLVQMSINPILTTPAALDEALDRCYGTDEMNALGSMFEDKQEEEADIDEGDEGPIMQYVQKIISEAIKRRASDIHLEPLEKRFRIRYRIDGVLQESENPPKRLQPSIISRLKLMADVSIAEKRKPQDGRIAVKEAGKELDLRVSVLPTAFGESIVMRILDKEGLNLGLPELGFFSDDQDVFEKVIGLPDGVFLITGPTGSGKSTTLYGALSTINTPDRKIITVEDPVEYMVVGINQVQIHKDVGMTFASALRAILRQAPNIIMVGEIRDLETAEIVIQAALTGHMVFSTLHTNDAVASVSRLVDMGVKSYLVALRGALAQRLVRKIHPSCKELYVPEESELLAIGMAPSEAAQATFYKAVGNLECPIGFKGRSGIFELFIINEALEELIYKEATLVELRARARELGMRNMREDGLRKVTAGITTIQELIKVTI